jgi:hypothetical protein
MRINANRTHHPVRPWTLAAKAPCAQSGCISSAEGVGLMPFIGVGTFWVAALLGSSPYIHSLPDSDRTDSLT